MELIWANGAISKEWLEVITLANANTGLAQSGTLPASQPRIGAGHLFLLVAGFFFA